MNLREYLEEYRALTLDMMDEIQKSGQIASLIEKREEIIKVIKNSDFDKEEIKKNGNSLDLIKLEEELQVMYKKEKVKVKTQMENMRKAKNVNNNYKNVENRARVFNKSI